MGRSREIFWYAIRVLKEVRFVIEELRHENKETYYATQMKEVTYRGKTKIKRSFLIPVVAQRLEDSHGHRLSALDAFIVVM